MRERLFKLCTTSFIVPDHIIPNVRKLGPYFDEIELLVFESQPETVLPSKEDVQTLAVLAEQHNITYNVHLPVDISLSSGAACDRQKAAQKLLKVLDRFSPLKPTTHTLHLDLPGELRSGERLTIWKKEMTKALDDFLGKMEDPKIISIETLEYPFSMIEDFIIEKKLPVCLDMGHAVKYGYDWQRIVQTHKERLPLVHLHGVDLSTTPVKDHTGLDCLGKTYLDQVISFLNTYTGVVSLEVFNLENLTRSLAVLEKYYTNIPRVDIQYI